MRRSWVLVNLAEKARKLKLDLKLHCEEHQEELKLFCETDKKLICLICRDSQKHKSHNFLPIVEAVEIYKGQVKSSFDSLTEKKSTVLEMEQQQKQKISQIRKQSDGVKSSLDSLTERKLTVLELEQKQKRKSSQIREQSVSLQSHITPEFTERHQILTEKEQRLIRDLGEDEEQILNPMQKNL
ncbi:hypothetical protein scyTo_0013371 [Scyliorhinus torazame]|uniref:RING-type E3 ubiquitin transferase n=1 Tax=Scyliorhinus torazame TaxID=75743 RepID=A0A401NUY6_SCYTO|nr:hypothetical protein [Scyliorhinus torazame]